MRGGRVVAGEGWFLLANTPRDLPARFSHTQPRTDLLLRRAVAFAAIGLYGLCVRRMDSRRALLLGSRNVRWFGLFYASRSLSAAAFGASFQIVQSDGRLGGGCGSCLETGCQITTAGVETASVFAFNRNQTSLTIPTNGGSRCRTTFRVTFRAARFCAASARASRLRPSPRIRFSLLWPKRAEPIRSFSAPAITTTNRC